MPLCNSHRLTINGQRASMTEWAKRAGVSISALSRRVSSGWRGERLLNPPRRAWNLTPEQHAEHVRQSNQRRYSNRLAKKLCQRCGEKIRYGKRRTVCAECVRVMSIKRGTGMRDAAIKRLNERIAFIVKTSATHSAARQAKELGLAVTTVYWIRHEAIKRGHALRRAGLRGSTPSDKWDAIDANGERCSCGLLLPCHSCPSTDPEARTPLTMPEGCRW